MRRQQPPLFYRIAPLALGFAACNGVVAAEWTNSVGVTPGITFTDNVCLQPDNEQTEFIGLLTPDIELRGEGSRATLNMTAALEMNTLSDSKLEELGCTPARFGNRKQFAPKLDANGNAELVDNWFYINADASIGQNSVVQGGAGGGDSFDRTGNTNTSSRYGITPYLSHRFKDTAALDLRYTWDQQKNSVDRVGDSDQQRVNFRLDNIPGSSSMSWGVQADYDRVQYSATPGRNPGDLGRPATDSELKSAQINLGYNLNRVWQVNGFVGQEKNDFVSDTEDIDGDYWDVGLRWTPTTRTTIDVGTGDRFFGTTPRFKIDHRHRHSVFTAEYKKSLTYDRNLRTNGSATPGQGQDATDNSTSPILDERFSLSYSYQGRRTTVRFRASHSDQTRAEDGRDSTFQNIGLNANRRMSRNLRLSAGLSWDETDPRGARSTTVIYSQVWNATLSAQQTLSQNLDLTLEYKFLDRQSDSEANEYQENNISLLLKYKL